MCDSRIPEGIIRNANVCFVLVCLLLMGGCGAPQTPHITSLVIVPGVSSVSLGKSVQLKATGLFSDGSRRDMTAESVWVSSKPDVVRIDSFGRASAVKEGQATVTATANQTSTPQPLPLEMLPWCQFRSLPLHPSSASARVLNLRLSVVLPTTSPEACQTE